MECTQWDFQNKVPGSFLSLLGIKRRLSSLPPSSHPHRCSLPRAALGEAPALPTVRDAGFQLPSWGFSSLKPLGMAALGRCLQEPNWSCQSMGSSSSRWVWEPGASQIEMSQKGRRRCLGKWMGGGVDG